LKELLQGIDEVRNASSMPNVVFQIVFESMYQVKQFKKKIPGYEEIFAVEVAALVVCTLIHTDKSEFSAAKLNADLVKAQILGVVGCMRPSCNGITKSSTTIYCCEFCKGFKDTKAPRTRGVKRLLSSGPPDKELVQPSTRQEVTFTRTIGENFFVTELLKIRSISKEPETLAIVNATLHSAGVVIKQQD